MGMNIYQRIAEVMKEVQYLAKDDSIEFKSTKYKAISEEKVTVAVRESLVKNGIVIVPIEQEHHRVDMLSTVNVRYRVQNIEDPADFIEVVLSGTGVDTQDKGVGKAMTYAYKYMLLRTFAIPTGEDPDKISSAETDDKLKCCVCGNGITPKIYEGSMAANGKPYCSGTCRDSEKPTE